MIAVAIGINRDFGRRIIWVRERNGNWGSCLWPFTAGEWLCLKIQNMKITDFEISGFSIAEYNACFINKNIKLNCFAFVQKYNS